MATSPVQQIINSIQLANATASLYQAPIGTWVQILSLKATNVDTVVHTVTFQIVPSSGTGTAANTSTKTLAILPGNTYLGNNEYGLVLNPGDSIWGFADTAAVVNCFASGLLTLS